MENATYHALSTAKAGETVAVTAWLKPSQLPHNSEFSCWEINLFRAPHERTHCLYLTHIDSSLPGGDWDGQKREWGTLVSDLPIDAPLEEVARAVLARIRALPQRDGAGMTILVEHPRIREAFFAVEILPLS